MLNLPSKAEIFAILVHIFRKAHILEKWRRKVVVWWIYHTCTVCRAEVWCLAALFSSRSSALAKTQDRNCCSLLAVQICCSFSKRLITWLFWLVSSTTVLCLNELTCYLKLASHYMISHYMPLPGSTMCHWGQLLLFYPINGSISIMDKIILTQKYVPFHFVLLAIEQCPEQRAVSLQNVCIHAFHPKGDLSTANDTKNLFFSIGGVT